MTTQNIDNMSCQKLHQALLGLLQVSVRSSEAARDRLEEQLALSQVLHCDKFYLPSVTCHPRE